MVFAVRAAAEIPGASSLPQSVSGSAVTPAMTSSRAEVIYDRYAAGLYRQALLTLGDAGLAEQVVSDVILDECLRPAADGDTDAAAFRLRISAVRRCRALAGDTAWRSRDSGRRRRGGVLDCLALTGLTGRERAALALVIFGGFGYAEAARELAIAPKDVAALLCAVLATLTSAGAPA